MADPPRRILLAHRYLWPDAAPYGMILLRLAEGLAQDGHEVAVQSAVPGYRPGLRAARQQVFGRLRVHRAGFAKAGRGVNTALYLLALCLRILRDRPDIVIVATTPPVLPAWLAGLAARPVGARLIYHVQDIHPEAAVAAGLLRPGGLPARLLLALDKATLGRAAAIVTLSPDMAATLQARAVPHAPPLCIENPALIAPAAELRTARIDPAWRKGAGRRRAIFAGNLGRFQNLPLLAEGVALLFAAHPELELCFLGDGRAGGALRTRWQGHPQVRFLPQMPLAAATALLAEADVGLVSLGPGMAKLAVPAKLHSYAALGLPVAALIDPG